MSESRADDREMQRQLSMWISLVPEAQRALPRVLLPAKFPLDHSPASLDALEARLLEHYEPGGTVERGTAMTESAMTYLGESLLAVAGGTWGWNRRPVGGYRWRGQPVVCPDPELQLQPIAPLLLLTYAMRKRTGSAFAAEFARLGEAVRERREREPGWEPAVRQDPGQERARAELAVWLADRRAGFEEWARETGRPDRWDFSPESLDALEALVRSRHTGGEEIGAARRGPFLQGAAWYIGEVVCRAKGARWKFEPFAVGGGALPALFGAEESGTVDEPFAGPPKDDDEAVVYPVGILRGLFTTRDELDNPIETHLRDAVGDLDPDGEDGEDGEAEEDDGADERSFETARRAPHREP
ncbi:hypothetical protein [Streptomyces sp. NPDC101150]|uniref:hypothetical protein n=1 Tax=Streptomyces sp. NPDC101150 TaxID=3366114 RepID=UPI003826817D